MKIYHLLAKQPILKPISGDKINEINFLKALSTFAEVYYNNQRFLPDEPDFGLDAEEIYEPMDGCDIYYVRNNIEVFEKIKGRKIWFSYPYDEEGFKTANAVSTFNLAWKEGLDTFHQDPSRYDFFCNAFPKNMIQPKGVINVKQVLGDHFESKHGTHLHFRYKACFGYGFTIGYFGRIVEETLPKDYLSIIDDLKSEISILNTVFAGSIRVPLEEQSIINVKYIPFEEMPYATSACDILLANEQPEANWAGSAKPLEAMACGVPIIVSKRPARVNQLGEDYPLYYSSPQELKELILKLYKDSVFYKEVQSRLIAKARAFYPEQIAGYLKQELETFIAKNPLESRLK